MSKSSASESRVKGSGSRFVGAGNYLDVFGALEAQPCVGSALFRRTRAGFAAQRDAARLQVVNAADDRMSPRLIDSQGFPDEKLARVNLRVFSVQRIARLAFGL